MHGKISLQGITYRIVHASLAASISIRHLQLAYDV